MDFMALFHMFVIFASVMVLSRAVPMPMDNGSRMYKALLQHRLDDSNDMSQARNLDALGDGNLVRSDEELNSLEPRMAAEHNRFEFVGAPRKDQGHTKYCGPPPVVPPRVPYNRREGPGNIDEIDASDIGFGQG